MQKIQESMTTSTARIHDLPSGAIQIYVDKEMSESITLPKKAKLKAVWNAEKEELTISKLE
jgi:hypothetical protein